MTHILHVVESFGGGVLSILQEVLNQQVRDGHQVSLVYSIRDETPSDWRQLFDPRIHCYFLPMVRAIQPIRDIKALWQLCTILQRIRPDIVHLHSSKAGAIGRMASCLYRQSRYFFSPHGLSFLQKDKQVYKKWFFLFLEKLLTWSQVTVIACSASEAEQVRQHLSARVWMVENAVNPQSIPVKTQVNPRLRIGCVGRIGTQKHPELFASIALACQDLPLDFFWIGAGEARGEKILKNAGVSVTGWLPRAQVLATLSSWDIYIQPSRWEGMPVAVIEAMLAGLPTLVSNVVGNKDVVLPGKTGFIANSQKDFLRAIAQLLSSPQTILTMGQAARELALTRFSSVRMTQTLYQVYGLST